MLNDERAEMTQNIQFQAHCLEKPLRPLVHVYNVRVCYLKISNKINKLKNMCSTVEKKKKKFKDKKLIKYAPKECTIAKNKQIELRIRTKEEK